MSEHWKKHDRPRPPCTNCGAELYEKFWGGGGWAKTDKSTDEAHSERDCIVRLHGRMQTILDIAEARLRDDRVRDNNVRHDLSEIIRLAGVVSLESTK